MTIVRYYTANSTYEVDHAVRQARRVVGIRRPTPNMRTNGEWRTYQYVQTQPDKSLLFVWGWQAGVLRRTLTSPVIDYELHHDSQPAETSPTGSAESA